MTKSEQINSFQGSSKLTKLFSNTQRKQCETLMTYHMETFVWCLLTTRLFFSIIQRLINLLFLLLCIHLCTLKIICKFYILYSKKFDTEPCWHPKPPSNSLSFFIFIYKLLHDIRKAFSLHALWLLNLQMSSLISSTKQKCFTEQRLNLFEGDFSFLPSIMISDFVSFKHYVQ